MAVNGPMMDPVRVIEESGVPGRLPVEAIRAAQADRDTMVPAFLRTIDDFLGLKGPVDPARCSAFFICSAWNLMHREWQGAVVAQWRRFSTDGRASWADGSGGSGLKAAESPRRSDSGSRATKMAGFPCFSPESGYIPRHLTRKHGSKGRPVAAGPQGSFAHTLPEEPTGELNDGATRFFYASAA